MRCKTLLIGALLLCVAGYSAAQSFDSLKKKTPVAYNTTLNKLLNNDDVPGMKAFLAQNPATINEASSTVTTQGFGKKPIISPIPLFYDAVEKTLQGACSTAMCWEIVNAGCDLNVPYEGKTPIYLILDFIATHSKDQCGNAEQLLIILLARSDLDVNLRYKSLLPPMAYLIRENHRFLGRFDKNYISDNVLKSLIDKGTSVNTYDDEGNSLMSFAIDTDNTYLSDYFIKQGITLTKKNAGKKDALYQSIVNQNIEIIKQITATDEGQKMLRTDYLNQAISIGNFEIVKLICEKGVEITLNTLTVKPDIIRQNPELYNYLTKLFAKQANTLSDAILFIKTFEDKFALMKDKLYAEIDKMQTPPINKINVLFDVGRCFSQKRISDYYTSKETYNLLLKEVSDISILTSSYAQIKDDSFNEYMLKHYSGGINAWKELVADFPERKVQIIDYTRKYLPASDGYYYTRWSSNIEYRLSSIRNTRTKCSEYIYSGVPDAEGQRLAETYLNEANNAERKYRNDLSKAQSDEKVLYRESEAIKEKIESSLRYAHNLAVPPYSIISHTEFMNDDHYKLELLYQTTGQWKSLNFKKTIRVEYDKRFGNGYLSSETASWYKSLDELVIHHVFYYNGWQSGFNNYDERENLINQYKVFGLKEWYRIEFKE
jgi:hypothetical protein